MAIEFHCPYCDHEYKLKDEFAGKKATCKNPNCRQVIVIPKPVTVPDSTPLPSAEELEAAALSALSDDAPKQNEKESAEKVIPMTCTYCEHKWTEPFSKAGKNTLCPNPDCRQRLKVPELKVEEQVDWRQTRTKLPSGAKQNFEKLEGVEDAANAKLVSGTALREADATGIEYEPRPLKQKVLLGLALTGIIAAIGLGSWLAFRTRTTGQEDQLFVEARKSFDETAKELTKPEGELCSAMLSCASGEYALRHNTTEKLKEAQMMFGNARDDLKQIAGPEQQALGAELALTILALGGTDDQVKEQIRYRWQPDIATGRMKLNERVHTVHDELRSALNVIVAADFDFRIALLRRLTRELHKKGQPALAADSIPHMLFTEPEKDEARAVVALELFRLDRDSQLARRIAEDLKSKIDNELAARAQNTGMSISNPYPASAHILFVVLLNSKNLAFVPDPPRSGSLSDAVRFSHVGIALLQEKSDEALKLALRPDRPESQLRSLVLCSEWMTPPATALEEADKLLTLYKGKRDVTFSQSQILRLSQIAAANGMAEKAKEFANSLTNEGLKAWAIGDAVHLRLAANPKEKAEAQTLELSEDYKKLKLGDAWGVLWMARRNAMLSGDRTGEKKTAAALPAPVRPFAVAGIALGLQDR